MAHIEIVPDTSLPGASQVRLQLPPGWSRFFALRNHGLQRANEGSPARWQIVGKYRTGPRTSAANVARQTRTAFAEFVPCFFRHPAILMNGETSPPRVAG